MARYLPPMDNDFLPAEKFAMQPPLSSILAMVEVLHFTRISPTAAADRQYSQYGGKVIASTERDATASAVRLRIR